MARSFTIASDEILTSMISAARSRLVIVAPGLSREVASFLAARITENNVPRVLSIILDLDPEVCRLGLGDIETFDILSTALAERGLSIHTQQGVRIGLIVADSEVLVFSPTPRLIEASPNSEDTPNAIRIGEDVADLLAIACGAQTAAVEQPQEVGTGIAANDRIERAKEDLKENPPRQFDLARVERVFNYKLEFVEFSIDGYQLTARSVPLPATLLGLGDSNLQERMRNTFRAFETGSPFEFEITDPADSNIKFKINEKWLRNEADKLRKEYLIPLGSSSYGNLILKRRRPEFEIKVHRLQTFVDLYAAKVRENIAEKIRVTRDALVAELHPRVKAKPPQSWTKHTVFGSLSDEALKQNLEEDIDKAFEKVELSFNPTVACLFKGVTHSTITADTHFRAGIEKYFGKDEAAKLFSEYDVARTKGAAT